jgi:hypothetical protein
MNRRNRLLTVCLTLMLLSAGLSYAYLSLKGTGNLDKPDEGLPDLPNLDYQGNASSREFQQASMELSDPGKIRSFTQMLYRTVYECGHEETHIIPAPHEMIGLSKDALAGGAPILMTCIGELLKGKHDTLDTYCSATAEYVRINKYVYSHKNPDNTYITHTGQLIGHPLGPDADGVYLIVAVNSCPDIEPGNRGQATLFFGYERHGEGALGQPWRASHGIEREFLWGIVETRKVLGLSAGVAMSPAALELCLKAESIENAGHIPGARALEGHITITVKLHYDHPLPNP